MEEIKFRIKEDAKTPEFLDNGFEVYIDNIFAIYKGDVKLSEENLEKVRQNFIDRGYIKLRKDERVIFGTGVEIMADYVINFTSKEVGNYLLEKGIIINGIVENVGEIKVIARSSDPYLPQINKGDKVLKVSFYENEPMTNIKYKEVWEKANKDWLES